MTKKDATDAAPETSSPDALTYGEPVKVEDGVRVSASDGEGNTLSITADSAEKAKAGLRTAFKQFKSK